MRRTYHWAMVGSLRTRLVGLSGSLIVFSMINWVCMHSILPRADIFMGVFLCSIVFVSLVSTWLMDAAGGLNPVFITRHKAQGCTTPVVCGSEQGSATTILSDSVGIGIMLTMLITVYLSHDIAFSGPIWVTVVIELGALLMLMVFSHRRVSVMT